MSAPELGIHTSAPGPFEASPVGVPVVRCSARSRSTRRALDLQPVLSTRCSVWWTAISRRGWRDAGPAGIGSRKSSLSSGTSQLARVRARYRAQRRPNAARSLRGSRRPGAATGIADPRRGLVRPSPGRSRPERRTRGRRADRRTSLLRSDREEAPDRGAGSGSRSASTIRVQLIASAGSGKTSTMVAKAGWTIRKGLANADEILLLAFNKSAAAELGDRCEQRLANANISTDGLRATTFHAFGLKVIGEATGAKPRLAAGLDTDNGVPLLADVVRALRRSSADFAASWSLFQNVLGVPMTGDAEPEPDAWDPQKRRSGYRDLNLDVMKSAGERAIANWLIKSGVEFDYECPYEVNVADAQHSQYRPDFFYPAAGVYHEHWALVSGQPEPPGFEGYLQSSAWKKRLHAANGTVLIETAARDLANGSLFESLERQLRASGIEPDFDPDRAVPGTPLLTDREMSQPLPNFSGACEEQPPRRPAIFVPWRGQGTQRSTRPPRDTVP